ncbi:MAG: hypothetical protein JWO92_603 [Chitinophagaceae bacterium]|nr:hypothetical protein [Chitinophagaceae bacterium]
MIDQPTSETIMAAVTIRSQNKRSRTRLKISKENQKLYRDDKIVCQIKTFIEIIFTLKITPSTMSLTVSIIK